MREEIKDVQIMKILYRIIVIIAAILILSECVIMPPVKASFNDDEISEEEAWIRRLIEEGYSVETIANLQYLRELGYHVDEYGNVQFYTQEDLEYIDEMISILGAGQSFGNAISTLSWMMTAMAIAGIITEGVYPEETLHEAIKNRDIDLILSKSKAAFINTQRANSLLANMAIIGASDHTPIWDAIADSYFTDEEGNRWLTGDMRIEPWKFWIDTMQTIIGTDDVLPALTVPQALNAMNATFRSTGTFNGYALHRYDLPRGIYYQNVVTGEIFASLQNPGTNLWDIHATHINRGVPPTSLLNYVITNSGMTGVWRQDEMPVLLITEDPNGFYGNNTGIHSDWRQPGMPIYKILLTSIHGQNYNNQNAPATRLGHNTVMLTDDDMYGPDIEVRNTVAQAQQANEDADEERDMIPFYVPAPNIRDDMTDEQKYREYMDGLRAQGVAVDVPANNISVPTLPPIIPPAPPQPGLVFNAFPFCIPWDVYDIVTMMIQPATEPVIEANIFPDEIMGHQIEQVPIRLDFSHFEQITNMVRWAFRIMFLIALILMTRRFIWTGGG